MNKIRKWLTWKRFWKRFWTIHGCIQLGLEVLFIVIGNLPMAYTCALAAMAFFGIAECKKEEK